MVVCNNQVIKLTIDLYSASFIDQYCACFSDHCGTCFSNKKESTLRIVLKPDGAKKLNQ